MRGDVDAVVNWPTDDIYTGTGYWSPPSFETAVGGEASSASLARLLADHRLTLHGEYEMGADDQPLGGYDPSAGRITVRLQPRAGVPAEIVLWTILHEIGHAACGAWARGGDRLARVRRVGIRPRRVSDRHQRRDATRDASLPRNVRGR